MSASNSNRAAVAAVLAVAVVVVATLVLVQTLGGSGDDGVGTAAEPAASAPAETPAPGQCVEPPALPAEPKQFDQVPPKSLAENATWTATVHTSCGDVVMELDGAKAPQTVSSFINLAREGYWDASPCHRLVPRGIFVLQCGDPTGTGSGSPGYGYGVENAPDDDQYPRGTLAMARATDPESNGGQFFIVWKKTELMDSTGYSIFGRVTEGMDIVDRVAEQGVGGTLGPEAPKQPISILSVDVEKAT